MLDPGTVEQVAAELGARPDLIEKEWHVVRALGVLATMDHGEAVPVFSGGTSLSIGWGLIERFSEDIDFKVAMPVAATKSATERRRRTYRQHVTAAMTAAGFELAGEPRRGNEHRFFSADFNYQSSFTGGLGLRSHIQLEMSFEAPALTPEARPLRSIVSRVFGKEPEVAAFSCIDPVETAANKLSALAWRVCVRQRGAVQDDPRIIRHVHDLAALEQRVSAAPRFVQVLRDSLVADTNRGGGRAPLIPQERLNRMVELLTTDPLWAAEYDEFVQSVSFAAPERQISFRAALGAVRRLVAAGAF